MRRLWPLAIAGLVGLVVVGACSANSSESLKGAGPSAGGEGGEGVGGEGGGTVWGGAGGGTGGTLIIDAAAPDTGPHTDCNAGPDEDKDQDGWSINMGDCNDCDPNANPGAYDVIGGVDGGPSVDEDCDGTIDNEPTGCDDGLDLNDNDPMNGAKAIGLCRVADPNGDGPTKTWGVLSARYVKADGTDGMNPVSHGLVDGFGAAAVQQGSRMLVLSSGTARAPGQAGFRSPEDADMGTYCDAPMGNLDTANCPAIAGYNDPAALEVEIRVPTNANSFKFYLNFYTYEFPMYICSMYNDYYLTIMDPKPDSSPDGNISFDQDGKKISVNNSLLQVCPPGTLPNFTCPLGTDLLANTGFDEGARQGPHAATGWLQTIAPVVPGSVIKLRFAIWDSSDHILDSTVLIDNFEWSASPAGEVKTEPVPVPK